MCFYLTTQEEAYWEGLERSGAAWAVTTIDAPYIVMHATAAWYKMFNVKHSQGESFALHVYFTVVLWILSCTVGSYQHMYSIMSLIGRDTMVEDATGTTLTSPLDTTFSSSNAYVGGWKETTGTGNKSTHQSATNALLTEMHEGYRTNRYKQVHGVLCFSLPKKKSASVPANHSAQTGSATKKGQGHNLMCTLHVYPIYASGEDPSQSTNTNNSATTPHTTAASTATDSTAQVHSLSASKLAQSAPHRNKTAPGSPMRDFTRNSQLASVNTGTTPGPLPHETSALRRSNTQMSSASFASTVRSSKRPVEPDVPRPVYFAILFHELTEQVPEVLSTANSAHSPPPRSSASTGSDHGANSGANASASSYSGSPSGSGSGSGLAGTLQSLIPRFWSSDKSPSGDSKGEYQHVSSADSNTYGGSFSVPRVTHYSADGGAHRHSFS